MKRRSLDDNSLLRRKDNFSGYIFCPVCGRKLGRHIIDNSVRLKCSNSTCDFIYYHNPVPAAGALVIQDNKVLLVKRAAPPKIDWWCLPAGFMEWSEHPSETALREIREETGLEVRLESLFEIYTGHDDPRTNALLILYIASVIGGQLRAADDAAEAAFFGFSQLPENIAFASHRQAFSDYKRRFSQEI
ncbi:MAG: NUDIX hydrolase [candidate division Zixibacteria bacterium]|nr:NUDIX hydrolase [candidate division Zixibacteria bacterium]